ncbi:MAG: isocitrate dehydrogenase (NADP(+)), partial [Desulfobacteraceae bacterium]|nr:isocitrate dehydrogenase (NADP(+)) [Desulfobacteraceae bacterium]
MEDLIKINNDGSLSVPDNPIIGYIPGDGTGPDIWNASRIVLDNAVKVAYQGKKEIAFKKLHAGEDSFDETGEWLPEKTLEKIKEYKVAIKGPLTTPVGHGMKSLNVALRQELDLYACIRPAKYIKSVPSPIDKPESIDMVIFRENTEDIYLGIEWEAGSEEADTVLSFVNSKIEKKFDTGTTGIGIKTISEKKTKRLIRKAIQFAVDHNRKNVTIMHKGNIMKFTEGAFLKWGYEVGEDEFKDKVISEQKLWDEFDGNVPEGKIVLKDRIADNMFQQVLLRPSEYDVIATPNLNGDYISDTLAAMVGGLGLAPGANIGDDCALFEATHGTAPKYAGLDKVNPGSVILSGAMMLDHLGWDKASALIHTALQKAILNKKVTYDLARQIPGSTELKCSEFAKEICS